MKKIVKTNGYANIHPSVRIRTGDIDFSEKPPYFAVDPRFAQEQGLSSLLKHPALTDRDKELITAIHDECGGAGGHPVGIDAIALRLGSTSRAGGGKRIDAVRSRTKRLVELGVLDAEKVPPPTPRRGRPPLLYTLTALPLENGQNTTPSPTLPTDQLDLFPPNTMLPDFWMEDERRLRIDDFWCGLIASALPIADKARFTMLETQVQFRSADIPLEISTRHGSRIPTIRSIKTVIAVLTMVEQIIQHHSRQAPGITPPTRFTVDLRDVLKLLGLPNKGGNRRTIVQYLREWENALFRFPELPEALREQLEAQFGSDLFGFAHHQLIHQLCGIGHRIQGQKIPTLIGFELPTQLVERIADRGTYNLFNVTPAIMSEDNPLAIALHLYCRKILGHKRRVFDIRLKILWKRIAATMRYADFRQAFQQLIARKQQELLDDPRYQEALAEARDLDQRSGVQFVEGIVLGYRFVLAPNDRVAISVDLDDPYVGYQSAHARLKQRKKEGGEGMNVTLDRFRKPSPKDS